MGVLPSAPLARGTVDVAGATLAIRSLTRAEALELRELQGHPGADRLGEVFLIAHALDIPEDDATAWWTESDGVVVQGLVQAIAVLSRLQGEDGKAPNSRPSGRSSRGT